MWESDLFSAPNPSMLRCWFGLFQHPLPGVQQPFAFPKRSAETCQKERERGCSQSADCPLLLQPGSAASSPSQGSHACSRVLPDPTARGCEEKEQGRLRLIKISLYRYIWEYKQQSLKGKEKKNLQELQHQKLTKFSAEFSQLQLRPRSPFP